MRKQNSHKPSFSFWLLGKIIPASDSIYLKSNFEELYENIVTEKGRLFSHFWVWMEIIKSFPGFFITELTWRLIMFKNFFKIAYRNIAKHKTLSFINIFGLAISIACCVFIFLWLMDELSYDRYHEKSSRIYRVVNRGVLHGHADNNARSSTPLAQLLKSEFPEVEAITRCRNYGFPVFRYMDKVFSEERVFSVDSTFFTVFSVYFLEGDPKTALSNPDGIILTRSMAHKYFGSENPMGKLINSNNQRNYIVTGVIENVPQNSHFHFDFLQSLVGKSEADSPVWFFNDFYTYIVLQENASVEQLEDNLFESVKKYIDPQIRGLLGITVDDWFASGGDYRYFLQPLTDIHLRSHMEFELEPNGNVVYIYLFATIAFGILLIACFNFVNLSTAYSEVRAKEVGIRKTVGSNRNQLIGQFVFETILYAFAALVFALAIVQVLLPAFNNLTAKELFLPYADKIYFVPILIGFTSLLGIIAGFYPALFLASFHPVTVLKGVQSKIGRRQVMRSVLVVFQFVISIGLIIGTLIIDNQLEFIQKKNLGFDKDQVVIIHKTDDLGKNIDTFKQELLKISGITSASKSSNLMGYHFEYAALFPEGAKSEKNHIICYVNTDQDFLKTYQMELKEGRFFEQGRQTDHEAIILNEAAVKELGMENPVGKKLINGMFKQQYPIIGVIQDFHFESLNQPIKPMLIANLAAQQTSRYMSVRIRFNNIREDIASIQNVWQQFSLNQPFEYEFFDRHFERYFLSEEKTAQIFMVFSILAIIIACLGLFGLAAFIADQKKKEIGVRKVLGASFSSIIILLYSKFTRWMLIAAIISWPIAFILMNKWLENFAYRTTIGFSSFISATILATAVAFMAVSYQSIKSALNNPVNTLKHE